MDHIVLSGRFPDFESPKALGLDFEVSVGGWTLPNIRFFVPRKTLAQSMGDFRVRGQDLSWLWANTLEQMDAPLAIALLVSATRQNVAVDTKHNPGVLMWFVDNVHVVASQIKAESLAADVLRMCADVGWVRPMEVPRERKKVGSMGRDTWVKTNHVKKSPEYKKLEALAKEIEIFPRP